MTATLAAELWSAVRLGQIVALSSVIFALSTYLVFLDTNVFQSPDETANHLFTRTFASSGKLWYDHELLQLDDENLLHPRGVVTYDGRAVPFNFLGLPLVYGAIYWVVGEQVRYIALVFAAVSALALYKTARELFNAQAEDFLGALVGCTPLLYYFNRPFMNALPAIAFFAVGVWMMARFGKRRDVKSFIVAGVAFSLASLFRYEYALLCVALLAILVYQTSRGLLTRRTVGLAGIGAVTFLVCFVIPVALLNEYVYGSWTTYGYSVFGDVYYPSSAVAPSGFESVLASGKSILIPSEVDPEIVVRNLVRFTVLQAPVFAVVSLCGAWMLLRRRHVRLRTLACYGLLLIFFVCYRGSSATWAGRGMEPNFDAAIVRYWLPLYVGLSLLAAFAFAQIMDRWLKLALTLLIAASAAYTLMWEYQGNLPGIAATLRRDQEWSERVLVPLTERNAVVFAGRSDKRIVPYRFSAAWWNGAEFYSASKVAASMSKVHRAGYPVYIRPEREVDLGVLDASLGEYGLTLAMREKSLYRVVDKQ